MSKASKRKHVTKEWLNQDFAPLKEGQTIVQHCEGRGNNLHSVLDENGDTFLVSMPVKFRKNLWVKKGHFLVVDPIQEGDKVRGEIVNVVDADFRRFLEKNHLWPVPFREGSGDNSAAKEPGSPELFRNTNRRDFGDEESSDDSDFE